MALGFQKDDEGYWIEKDPDAFKNYTLDYTKWLEAGDTLSTVTWDVGDLTRGSDSIVAGNKASIELGGGLAGGHYPVTAHIVTANGREDDMSFRIVVRDK